MFKYILDNQRIPFTKIFLERYDLLNSLTALGQEQMAAPTRSPFKTFYTSSGLFLRVSRSSHDADEMLRHMPSHHYWFHILNKEGSHVWVEGKKNQALKPEEIRQAAILALHYSKQAKNQAGDVQYTLKAHIEKKKHLNPGKVLVRRAQTLYISYTKEELKDLVERKKPNGS
jgi:predicted ribosome quality control (RQC) complex YloA/Tae2 family protein